MMEEKINKKSLRDFGFVIGFGFPIIFGWIIPLIRGHDFHYWSLVIGITALILGIVNPLFLYYPYKVWMKIGLYLGWVNSRLILGLVYLLILIPISLLMKLFGYDPLRKKITNQKSYRELKTNYKVDLTKIF